MKTLYIVRHAKSSWDYPELSDEERPLIEKGRKRTLKIARYLKDNYVKPDLMISSPAVRAKETALIIADLLGYPAERIVLEPSIYMAGIDQIMNLIYGVGPEVKELMIFGHNPGFTYLVNELADRGLDWLPTSGVARVDFDAEDWYEIPSAPRKTRFIVYPKMLK